MRSPPLHLEGLCCAKPRNGRLAKRVTVTGVQANLSASLCKVLALDDPLNDELSARLSGAGGFLK